MKRYTRLGVSKRKGNELKEKLENEKIAIEIETGKSDILANIEKCTGFSQVLCLVTEPQLKMKTEQQIKQYKNITVCFVKDFLITRKAS